MTDYFEWTKDMSVGDTHLDGQHQRLLSQINKIYEAIAHGATVKEVSEAIDFLEKYGKEHFYDEEAYMLKHQYPYEEEHHKEHYSFIKSSKLFKEKLGSGIDPREVILDIEAYLGQWWVKHIRQEDKKYATFIAD